MKIRSIFLFAAFVVVFSVSVFAQSELNGEGEPVAKNADGTVTEVSFDASGVELSKIK